ncbi:MAG: TonB-dependent receptor [Bacteroidetes bacterium]|nr:MAG: TonB-dependent receptor [Bacteroidota bacterium]
MYRLFLCFLFLGVLVSLPAQAPKGSIRGRLADNLAGNPIAFGAVNVFARGQDSLLSGAITDEKGRFLVRDLPYGSYRLEAQAIGFEPRTVVGLILSASTPRLDVGPVTLAPVTYETEAVEITGERPFEEIAPDRRIYRISQLPLADGGFAPDVLRQIPSLTVGMEGELALRGDGQVALFIDGRPSPLTGSARAAFLSQLPAASIERVEVITNPSARFDPEGTAGIINLVLKKDRRQGLSGSLNLTAATRHKYQAGTLLNYRTPHLNFMLNYGYRYEQRFGRGTDERAQPEVKAPSFIRQEADVLRRTSTHMIHPVLDLFLSPRQTLSIGTIINPRVLWGDETYRFDFLDPAEAVYEQARRQTEQVQRGQILDVDIDYDLRFAQEGRSLYANASYATFTDVAEDRFSQVYWGPNVLPPDNPDERQILNQATPSTTATLMLDYVHPWSGGGKWEGGFSYRARTFGNDYTYQSLLSQPGSLLPDTSIRSTFSYQEAVYAAYSNLSGKLGKRWSWQAGLRAEQVFTLGSPFTEATTDTFTYDYFRLFPSAYLTYQTPKRRSLKLSYSRRISRPDFDAVNPFPTFEDPYYLTLGNPGLIPEDIHSGELSFHSRGKRGSLTAAVYGRYVTQIIRRVQETLPSGIAQATYLNSPEAFSAGSEFIANGRLTKWWSGNATLNVFYARYTSGASLLPSEGLAWQVQALSNFRLPKDVMIQVSGQYRAPRPLLQGEMRPVGWVDVALRKSFFKRKAALTLRVSDVFNTLDYTLLLAGPGFDQTRYRKRESQIAYLTFSYRFGKPVRRQERPDQDDPGPGAGNLEEAQID